MKMKLTEIHVDNNAGTVTIETETPRRFLGFKLKPIKRTFMANKEYPKGFYNWVEMPDKTLVDTNLSFQLDTWKKFDFKKQ